MTPRVVRSSLVAATIAGCALTATSSAPATPGYYPPGARHCGSFRAEYRIYVSAKHVSCKRAVRIQKEFWRAPNSRKRVHGGGSGADGYVLLKRYPGWRCTSGAGGGGCAKGRAVAGYQN